MAGSGPQELGGEQDGVADQREHEQHGGHGAQDVPVVHVPQVQTCAVGAEQPRPGERREGERAAREPVIAGPLGHLPHIETDQGEDVQHQPQPEQHQSRVREPGRRLGRGQRGAEHGEPLRGHASREHRPGPAPLPALRDEDERHRPEQYGEHQQSHGQSLGAGRREGGPQDGRRRHGGEGGRGDALQDARPARIRPPPGPGPQQPQGEVRGEHQPGRAGQAEGDA